MPKIKVVNVDVLSYSGTTWLNLLLGSHPDAMSLGPPQRLWDLRDQAFEGACRVHNKACPFWAGFHTHWDREQNFFVALSEFSGRTVFLMDNASPEFQDATFHDPEIQVIKGRYIRDARAVTASYARKMAKNGISYQESIQPEGWFYPSFHAIPDLRKLRKQGYLVVRYEDAVHSQEAFLEQAGAALGLEYSADAFRFWEADHHLVTGNQGPIAMVRLHQGIPVGNFDSRSLYEEQLTRLKQHPSEAFADERWRTELTPDDLTEFDRLMGKKNIALGYSRD